MNTATELKQFVPSKVCLACDGCCRFRVRESCWQPRMTAEEKEQAALPDAVKRLLEQLPGPGGPIPTVAYRDIFICHFLNPEDNACGIYHARPFECRLYPFLLMKEGPEFIVGVHLLCPYVREKRDTAEWEPAARSLKEFFAQDRVRAFIARHPELAGAYQDYRDEIEVVFTVPAGRTKP